MTVSTMKNKFSNSFSVSIALIALLLITPTSFSKPSDAKTSLVPETQLNGKQKKPLHQIPIQDVQKFTTAITHIKKYYVKPVEDKELFENAIRGMLQGLDPHSTYLNEEEFKELQTTTSGEFSGLGIEVTLEEGVIKVISPIDGTPAHKAGVKAGDYIIRLNGKSVRGMKLREAVNKMRGRIGTKIEITIVRKGEKPFNLTIVRAKIKLRSIRSQLLEGKYGYIRISHFQAPTAKLLVNAIKKLQKEAKGQLHGLILDLRNNPGGLLDAAIEISDAFIHNDQKGKEELIVYTKGRLPGSEFTAIATPGDLLKGKPIVVLINKGSASGSEIVAGALQDNARAVIVGTTSFGKGSVQTIIPLNNKGGIKLTTALYYTPSGRSIQAQGLTPDIKVEAIEMPKNAKKPSAILNISEADLSGHLKNGSKKKGVKEKESLKNKVAVAEKDYQLSVALNILKALVIMKKSVDKTLTQR